MTENNSIGKNFREQLRDRKRIVVKIGSSSLQHPETGDLDYTKMDVLVRELCDMRNRGKDVVLVTSGAIALGKKAVRVEEVKHPGHGHMALKQACAAVGQARLMMTYQKLFAEYNQVAAQILMTKNTIVDNLNRYNAHNTFSELFKLGVIPIVNENDTVATYEIEFGDNDSLSAIVAALIEADLLILLSDIDGLYDVYWVANKLTGELGDEFNLYNASLGGELKGLVEMRDGNNGENFRGTVTEIGKKEDGNGKPIPGNNGNALKTVTVKVTAVYLEDMNKCTLSDNGGKINLGNQIFYYTDWEVNYNETDGSYYLTVSNVLNDVKISKKSITNREEVPGAELAIYTTNADGSCSNNLAKAFSFSYSDISLNNPDTGDDSNDGTGEGEDGTGSTGGEDGSDDGDDSTDAGDAGAGGDDSEEDVIKNLKVITDKIIYTKE